MSTTATLSPFGPLVLPTRRRPSGRATFQVGSREDDDDDSPDESPENNTHNDDDDDLGQLPPFHLKKSFDRPIPFPRTSPLPSSTHTENKKEQPLSPLTTTTTAAADTGTAAARSPRPSVSRTSSTPVSMFPHHPASADSSPCASPLSSSTATSPVVPPQKNVHFASQEEGGLASLLCIGDEIDRKTEGEGPSAPTGFSGRPSAYPFLNLNTVPRPTVYPPQSKSMDPLRHHPELGSQSPVTHPQDIQYSQSESNPVKRPDDEPPSPGGDLNLQLKEHTGAELALIGLLATITLGVACSDKAQGHLQICHALGILRPIGLLLHFGAALTTCAVLFTAGDTRSLRCLRLSGSGFFVLGLCSTVTEVSLYSWTVGTLITSVITVLLALIVALPGFYLASLKWCPKSPASEHRDIEA